MHTKTLKTAFLVVALSAWAGPLVAAETATSEFKFEGGVVFARGDYGLPSDTDVMIALFNPSVETDEWRVQASLPWVRLDGPASVVGDTGGALVPRTSNGVGDASLSITRKLGPDSYGWNRELGARVKFPTGDSADGLGTGETDVSVQVDLAKIGGKTVPFATVGYQFLGRSDFYPMEDGFFATGGFTHQVVEKVTLGFAGNWRQRTVTGGESGIEAMAFAQRKVGVTGRIQFFVLKGFTTASPDLAVGVSTGWSL